MSDPLARLNAGQGASLRLYAAERDLTRAGKRLRAARADAAVALTEARNAALSAHAAGVSERTIASALDVNRTTVRRWLGKPREQSLMERSIARAPHSEADVARIVREEMER